MFMNLLCSYSNTLGDDLHSPFYHCVKFTERLEVTQVTKGRDVL